jgi:hypothetical protein
LALVVPLLAPGLAARVAVAAKTLAVVIEVLARVADDFA